MAERMNRSLIEREICILLNNRLSTGLWVEVVNMACCLINGLPRASLEGKVISEVWICNHIDLDNLRNFGSLDYVHISSEDRYKLDPKSKKCVFVSYTKCVKRFKLWDPMKKRMVIIKDFVFNEKLMFKKSVATNVLAPEEETSNK